MPLSRVTVVFVHGFLSSTATWSRFSRLLDEDRDLSGLNRHTFGYATPALSVHPLRRIPNLNDVADHLRTFLRHDAAQASRLVLVSHSMGGLVVQRMLARTLADGRGTELARIARIVMFACPNSGADLALLLRRGAWFWRHPQERELRPLHEAVTDTHRIVINQVIHATSVTSSTCPIRIVAYAGETDGVVTPASARSVFPEVGVLPGDHRSIVRPDSPAHRSYAALRHHLLDSLSEPAPPASAAPAAGAAGPARPHPHRADAAEPAPPHRVRPRSATGTGSNAERVGRQRELVDALLTVPRMADPSYREQLYALLPERIIHQLRRDPAVRIELFSLVASLDHYPDLAPWEALRTALTTLAPDQVAVDEVREVLERHDLVSRRHADGP